MLIFSVTHKTNVDKKIFLFSNIIILMNMKRAEDQLNHLSTTLLGKQNRTELIKAYHACMKLKPMNYFVIDIRQRIDERLQFYCGVLPDEPRIYFCPD